MKHTSVPKPPRRPVASPLTASTSLAFERETKESLGLKQTRWKLTLSVRRRQPFFGFIKKAWQAVKNHGVLTIASLQILDVKIQVVVLVGGYLVWKRT
jgi:hypothetical protein